MVYRVMNGRYILYLTCQSLILQFEMQQLSSSVLPLFLGPMLAFTPSQALSIENNMQPSLIHSTCHITKLLTNHIFTLARHKY